MEAKERKARLEKQQTILSQETERAKKLVQKYRVKVLNNIENVEPQSKPIQSLHRERLRKLSTNNMKFDETRYHHDFTAVRLDRTEHVVQRRGDGSDGFVCHRNASEAAVTASEQAKQTRLAKIEKESKSIEVARARYQTAINGKDMDVVSVYNIGIKILH
jgi:hypothetical protein